MMTVAEIIDRHILVTQPFWWPARCANCCRATAKVELSPSIPSLFQALAQGADELTKQRGAGKVQSTA
jgi:hypothetical protein